MDRQPATAILVSLFALRCGRCKDSAYPLFSRFFPNLLHTILTIWATPNFFSANTFNQDKSKL